MKLNTHFSVQTVSLNLKFNIILVVVSFKMSYGFHSFTKSWLLIIVLLMNDDLLRCGCDSYNQYLSQMFDPWILFVSRFITI